MHLSSETIAGWTGLAGIGVILLSSSVPAWVWWLLLGSMAIIIVAR